MSCKLNTINSTTVTDSQRLAFNKMLGHLKRDLIVKPILTHVIKREEELGAELDDSDYYLVELEEKIAIVEEYVKKASQSPVSKK